MTNGRGEILSDESQERRPAGFAFTVKAGDSTALILEMLLQVRASNDALAGLLANIFGNDEAAVAALAKRYEELYESFLLQHAFRLQDEGEAKE